ncbi:AAA family ATPase [Tumebacillus sp. DT12]|uniref:AAA family ATPase n=1 Tax=Tumebacillus lacus TaxID=2995335 RepID=A0ABT3X060_9BACL|nr:AAA family ATPase [Tumebacillus lacus]MCX7569363.1 AAA family ATPase [Tumebacillus lacus]
MQPVKIALDARQWMTVLREVAQAAGRPLVLRVDAEAGTVSVRDEEEESGYRVTLTGKAVGQPGPAVCCAVSAEKLMPMVKAFSKAEGNLLLVVSRVTMLFKHGKKQVLLPNRVVEEPAPFGAVHTLGGSPAFDPELAVRFAVHDPVRVAAALRQEAEWTLKVEVGQGLVRIGSAEFATATRRTGVLLWPREAFCRRLQQFPAGCRVNVEVTGQAGVQLSSSSDGIVREAFVKPFPATSLYLSKALPAPKEKAHDPAPSAWTNGERRIEKGDVRLDGMRRPPRDTEDRHGGEDAAAWKQQPYRIGEKDATVPTGKGHEHSNGQGDGQGSSQGSGRGSSQGLEHRHGVGDGLGFGRSIAEETSEEAPNATALERLEELPGLAQVKKQIRDIAQFACFEKERLQVLGVEQPMPTMHMAFLGNPGTGKTMVARMIGKIFKEMGLITKGHVVEVDRQMLVGAYMGHTEANLSKYVKRALGGILFIDEAYTLYKKDSGKDFGLTAINGLVKSMEDHRDRLIVIVAGYRRPMEEFFGYNPGLRERIPFHLDFPDYDEGELATIASYLAAKDHYELTDGAKAALLRRVLRTKIDETFGNARTVRNLLDKAKIAHAVRLADLPAQERESEAYTRLTANDFPPEDSADADTLEGVLAELDGLVGLGDVKQLVRQMVDVLRLEKLRFEHGLENQPLTFHMAFTGNPGTGKTTVARLIGRLLRVLDYLPKGQFVEASRKDLIAGYVGQTTLRTADKIKEALGGVLFVDEAYALARRGQEGFGAEALATLIKEMEDKKGLITVILAGYTKEMEGLFQVNPGLRSRVRFHLHFPDYSATDLVEIVKRKAAAERYTITAAAEEKLWRLFLQASVGAGADFGNGRLAEQVLERAKIRLSAKIGQMESVGREELMTLTDEEFEWES